MVEPKVNTDRIHCARERLTILSPVAKLEKNRGERPSSTVAAAVHNIRGGQPIESGV
jgi:hypothetical protein